MRKLLVHFALSSVLLGFGAPSLCASALNLKFKVDIDQKWDGLTYSDPDIQFDYSLVVDTRILLSDSGTIPDGRTYSFASFMSNYIPMSPFTGEVMSHITDPLTGGGISTSIYREFSAGGYGSGSPETFEALFLTLDLGSDVSDADPSRSYSWTSYQRGFQRQGVLGAGDLLNQFTENSLTQYLISLVGSSDFAFADNFIISEWFPEHQYSTTTYEYGYAGYGTLVSVTPARVPVPEPSTVVLLALGCCLAGLARSRAFLGGGDLQ